MVGLFQLKASILDDLFSLFGAYVSFSLSTEDENENENENESIGVKMNMLPVQIRSFVLLAPSISVQISEVELHTGNPKKRSHSESRGVH